MFRPRVRRARNRSSGRLSRPSVEGLEGRLLLYGATGAQWVHPERITFSFVPDGTNIAGVASTMNAAMAARGIPTQVWQDQFRLAASTWAQYTGINIVEVGDNGAPYATSGNQQGDSRFGDIRIGGTPMGYGGLAMTWSPPPYNGGTLAGDMNFNTSSNIAWNLGASYDLKTVALHEFGHALGLGHSDGTTLVGMPAAYYQYPTMYSYYTWTKEYLTPDDVAGIQAIYGLRPDDAFDAAASNPSPATASNVTGLLDSAGRATVAGLNLNTYLDYDTYSVIVPPSTNGTLSVTLQSTNLSSLSPRLQLYDGLAHGIQQISDPGAFGSTLTITHGPVVPGEKYYIRVLAATAVPTGAGDYGLLINFGGGTMSPIQPPNTTVPEQPDDWGLWASLTAPGSDHGHGAEAGLDASRGSRGGGHDRPELLKFGSLLGVGETLGVSLGGRPLASFPGTRTPVSVPSKFPAPTDSGAEPIMLVPDGLPAPTRPGDFNRSDRGGKIDEALDDFLGELGSSVPVHPRIDPTVGLTQGPESRGWSLPLR